MAKLKQPSYHPCVFNAEGVTLPWSAVNHHFFGGVVSIEMGARQSSLEGGRIGEGISYRLKSLGR